MWSAIPFPARPYGYIVRVSHVLMCLHIPGLPPIVLHNDSAPDEANEDSQKRYPNQSVRENAMSGGAYRAEQECAGQAEAQ